MGKMSNKTKTKADGVGAKSQEATRSSQSQETQDKGQAQTQGNTSSRFFQHFQDFPLPFSNNRLDFRRLQVSDPRQPLDKQPRNQVTSYLVSYQK